MSIFAKKVCARRLSETGCSRCGSLGLIQGTMVRVQDGWRPVESLALSDRVAVFSGGYRTCALIESEDIWTDPFDCPSVVRPLIVPQGVLGNGQALRLQQDMRVILPSDPCADTGHVSIRAADLSGFRNVALETVPPKGAQIYRLLFDEDEGIAIAGGLWVMCPQTHMPLRVVMDAGFDRDLIGRRPVNHLTAEEAAAFLPVWAADT